MFLNEIMDRGLRGAFAGLMGSSVFGVWMAEKGGLAAIASMGGGSSPVLGLVMHLVISMGIGASFAVLFFRLAVGLIPSILWGLVYGFIWWFLGPLTLMSLMMGAGLQWTASAVGLALAVAYAPAADAGEPVVIIALLFLLLLVGDSANEAPL